MFPNLPNEYFHQKQRKKWSNNSHEQSQLSWKIEDRSLQVFRDQRPDGLAIRERSPVFLEPL